MSKASEKKTVELLEILNQAENSEGLKRYLYDTSDYSNVSFNTYFNELLDKKQISKSDMVQRSGIERTYLYHILNGSRTPGRDNALRLCIGAGLKLEETMRCLKLLSLGILYAKNKRDSIIIYSINRNFSIDETNSLLYEMGEKPLD
ncbi:MAG: helix-turn-helix transcriptional regulator [Lachnospiraceae bacterium]|nr:helix-turn-helix transcriptional regulator [Lachnospiraceae bacterium]